MVILVLVTDKAPYSSKDTNDAVSLEARRKKGSIKKSRSIFRNLIAEIEDAAIAPTQPIRIQVERLKKISTFDGSVTRAIRCSAGL